MHGPANPLARTHGQGTILTRVRATASNPHAPAVAAVAVILAGCLIVGYEARHSTFVSDDWSVLLGRRGFSADVLLERHAEHLIALPVLAYKLLLEVFGPSSYAPFTAVSIALHGATCLLLYVLARRCVGPWAALAPAAVLVVLGAAWQDLVWAFQMTYLGSVASGLGMVLCLERRDRRGDIAASSLLAISLLCSSAGLGFVVFAAVLLALERPRDWRRAWIVGVPLALYLAWYAAYGHSSARLAKVVELPAYYANALAAALTSVTGLAQTPSTASPYIVATDLGWPLAAVLAAALAWHLRRGGRIPPVAWGAAATALALWTAACLSNNHGDRGANSGRYQYFAATLLMLAAASIASGWRPTTRSGAVLAAVTLLACAGNVRILHRAEPIWALFGAYNSAETGVMGVARDGMSPGFRPEDQFTVQAIGNHSLSDVYGGRYLSFVDAFGSPSDSPSEILRRPEPVRLAADLVLAHAERLQPVTVPARAVAGPHCRSARSGLALGELAVGPGTLAVRNAPGTPYGLQLRRFAAGYRFVGFGLPGGTAAALTLPRDRADIPWQVRVVSRQPVRLCTSAAR